MLYDPDDDGGSPIVLTVMGLGVPEFPDVEEHPDVKKAIQRNKGGIFVRSEIMPSCNKAKPYLRKEIIRRQIIEGVPAKKRPRCKHWKIPQCIKWLREHAPATGEHELILEWWKRLLERMQAHYSDNSGSPWVMKLRRVRQWESLFHPSLLDDFERRHYQSDPTYWEKAADIFNSAVTLQTRDFSSTYGNPWDMCFDLPPPTEEQNVSASTLKQRVIKSRQTLIHIDERMKAGDISQDDTSGFIIKDYTTGPQALIDGKPIQNGDAIGYLMCLLRELDLFDEFVAMPPEENAATTLKLPNVRKSSGRKRKKRESKSSSSSKRRPAQPNESGGGGVTFLEKMERRAALDGKREELAQLRFQLSTEEALLLNVHSTRASIAKEYFEWKQKVEEMDLSEEDDSEEFEYFAEVRSSFEEMKWKKAVVADRVEKLKGLVEAAEEELEALRADIARPPAQTNAEEATEPIDGGRPIILPCASSSLAFALPWPARWR
ncbi:hypothetical protein ACHAWF_011177 [Thalassiosira exigua]